MRHDQRPPARPALTRAAARPVIVAALRALHPRGWLDTEIAARLGLTVWQVRRQRRRLGLRAHLYGRRHVRAAAAGRRRALRAAGYASLAELQAARRRAAVVRQGWPAGATPWDVAILAALRAGPRTTAEVAAELGRSIRVRNHQTAKDLRRLAALGWVERWWRGGDGRGHGGRRRVNGLAPAVLAGRRRWERAREG